MIKCLVVDDEKHAIEILTHHIEKMPMLTLVHSTTKSLEAFQYTQQNSVDLIFLDIHMPELEGLQFLKLLGSKSKIILTTAYPEYALEGYEHDILDYLLKPILFERFLKAVQKMINQVQANQSLATQSTLSTQSEEDYIFVKTESRGKITRIRINDILYVEAFGNYIGIHTYKGKTLTLVTMKDIELQIPSTRFVRIHKSYLVNITKIESIDSNQVFINKSPLPIGDKHKEYLLALIGNKIVKGKR
jgi:DNA-binding LytR/AlgR family response regulator